jgi:circadian clock protein KaiC
MPQENSEQNQQADFLQKCQTGIKGLDEVTGGGLPKGRPTLVCGGAGCGKTLLAMEFLVHGAVDLGEPGVFMSFEESSQDLVQNFASIGFRLNDLVAQNLIDLDQVLIDRVGVEAAGEYDLEGLFIRLGLAIDSIGAKRVVLDSLGTLFTGLFNDTILRSELRRLFCFLKDKGVTTIVTGEQGERTLTRYGLEEYVADCVIFLNHTVSELIATRRLRIVKYRGSAHGTNDYPFLIGDNGLSVMPISSLSLEHAVSHERISSGVQRLDQMMGGKGYFRGSSVLVTGTAGVGKSSLAAHFVDAACRRGERALYFAFEESRDQIIRNMLSIGIDLLQWVHQGLLDFRNCRPTMYGLEMHLDTIHNAIESFNPAIVVVDPISNLVAAANLVEVKSMLSRLVDYLKTRGITAFFTNLTFSRGDEEHTDVGMSSLMDTWLLLQIIEGAGERNRGLYILKSRGMEHSNQIREYCLTSNGVQLKDVYIGSGKVLTGAARAIQEAQEKAEAITLSEEITHKQRQMARKKTLIDMQVASLLAEFEADKAELERVLGCEKLRLQTILQDSQDIAELRSSDQQYPEGKNAAHT